VAAVLFFLVFRTITSLPICAFPLRPVKSLPDGLLLLVVWPNAGLPSISALFGVPPLRPVWCLYTLCDMHARSIFSVFYLSSCFPICCTPLSASIFTFRPPDSHLKILCGTRRLCLFIPLPFPVGFFFRDFFFFLPLFLPDRDVVTSFPPFRPYLFAFVFRLGRSRSAFEYFTVFCITFFLSDLLSHFAPFHFCSPSFIELFFLIEV